MPINKLVIISYANFLSLSNRSRQILSANDDFLVSINKEDYIKLSAEEKDKLIGVALTDEDHNAKIIEQKSLKKEISPKDLKFYLKDIQPITDVEVLKQSFMEKHKKQSRPYCPQKIFNKNYNSKKKGGR